MRSWRKSDRFTSIVSIISRLKLKCFIGGLNAHKFVLEMSRLVVLFHLFVVYGHSLVSDIESDTCCAYQQLIIQMAEVC
jgi:hypothetical protein